MLCYSSGTLGWLVDVIGVTLAVPEKKIIELKQNKNWSYNYVCVYMKVIMINGIRHQFVNLPVE